MISVAYLLNDTAKYGIKRDIFLSYLNVQLCYSNVLSLFDYAYNGCVLM